MDFVTLANGVKMPMLGFGVSTITEHGGRLRTYMTKASSVQSACGMVC